MTEFISDGKHYSFSDSILTYFVKVKSPCIGKIALRFYPWTSDVFFRHGIFYKMDGEIYDYVEFPKNIHYIVKDNSSEVYNENNKD